MTFSLSLADVIDDLRGSWLQYLNHGTENVYEFLNGVAKYKVPATAVKKTEMELLFEVRLLL